MPNDSTVERRDSLGERDRSILDDGDVPRVRADDSSDVAVRALDIRPCLVGRSIPSELALAAEMLDDCFVDRCRHQRGTGVVQVNSIRARRRF
jgi:hypothetical protein